MGRSRPNLAARRSFLGHDPEFGGVHLFPLWARLEFLWRCREYVDAALRSVSRSNAHGVHTKLGGVNAVKTQAKTGTGRSLLRR